MTEKQTRQRKKKAATSKSEGIQNDSVSKTVPKRSADKKPIQGQGDEAPKPHAAPSKLAKIFKLLNFVVAVGVMLVISYKHSEYMYTLHENNLWFTNIKEVEREISFRTECGLYYSYFKHIVKADSISQGVLDLTQDNVTEHLNTINVLSRFNIYAEVFLAAVYKSCSYLQEQYEGIMFYIMSVFGVQAVLVASLYLMAWFLSGTWFAGVLAAAFYVFNKEDTTRVGYVVALRENFALPFLWLQLAAVTYYFKPACLGFRKNLSIGVIAVSTLLFSINWQFNQFVLLLQSMALFGAQVLHIVPHNKIATVYLCQMLSMLTVCVAQFFNTMILGGVMMSFVPAAILVMLMQDKMGRSSGFVRQTLAVIGYIITVFMLTAVFNISMKYIIHEESDEHIYKFVLAKFGLSEMSTDFDVQLYLCNGAFEFLSWDFIERLSTNILLPVYAFIHIMGVQCLIVDYCQQSSPGDTGASKKSDDAKRPSQRSHLFASRPDLAYTFIQPVFFGIMAVTTLRMKYLWTPYMCVMVAGVIGNTDVWTYILAKLAIRSKNVSAFLAHLWLLAVLGSLLFITVPRAQTELGELREFYDPDTVDLMEWIQTETKPNEAFSGSMQLLAGVKLCTGRPITNHPHYEDKELRQRTKELYQMYGKQPAGEVHRIMKKYNATYIILEDSICLARSRPNLCRLPDIVDISNGVVPDSGSPIPGLEQSSTKRFCDEIRYGSQEFNGLFRLVFQNKTFRVYKVLV